MLDQNKAATAARRRAPRLARSAGIAGMVLVAVALVIAAAALARMRSIQLDRHLCETAGGGKFVDIPGFPGERIDRRLIRDIRWMDRHYKIFITDGFAMEGHAWNGEHPLGLALDIVPDKLHGGSWKKIARLARWAEPRQDDPRDPFRWVGWNGGEGHGRGDHLHLSWLHSESDPGDPARVVYTRRCPQKGDAHKPVPGKGDSGHEGSGGGHGDDDRPDEPGGKPPGSKPPNGGSEGETPELPPTDGEGGVGADPTGPNGGVGPRRPYAEDGGVEAGRLERKLERLRELGPEHD